MKKPFHVLTIIFVLSLSIPILNSCSKDEELSEQKLVCILNDMEGKVISGDIVLGNLFDAYDEINLKYFSRISKLKSFNAKGELHSELEKIVTDYNNGLLKSGTINKGEIQDKTLSYIDELILKSYVNALKLNEAKSIISVADYYIQNISKLNLPDNSLQFCLNFISFHKNLMIYLNIDCPELKSANSVLTQDWLPCSGRDCWDCCMYRKAQQMEDWNWIEWVEFMMKPAYEVAWWGASCGWDCIVN